MVAVENQTSLETVKTSPETTTGRRIFEEEDEKSCWVCFASESDEPTAEWTHPCR